MGLPKHIALTALITAVLSGCFLQPYSVTYLVEHYTENPDGERYILKETEVLWGNTEREVTAFPQNYPGFTENPSHPSRSVSGRVSRDGSLRLRLYYDYLPYTVFLETNGAGAAEPIAGQYLALLPQPGEPERIGFSLTGWYRDEALQDPWNFAEDQVTESITLYAGWEPVSSTITFDPQTGSGGTESETAVWDQELPPAAAPVKAGYLFKGYYDGTQGTGTRYYSPDMEPDTLWNKTSDTVLYASWVPETQTSYTVKHYFQNIEDDQYTPDESLTESLWGTTDTLAQAVKKDLYGFTENSTLWFRTAQAPIAGEGSSVLELYYDRNLYSCTFHSSPGSAVAAIPALRYQQQIPEPDDPSRTGYHFRGWHTDDACSKTWNFDTDVITADTELYAKWEPMTFEVQLYMNYFGSPRVLHDTVTAVYDSPMPASTEPYSYGNKFSGFYGSANGTMNLQDQYYDADMQSTRIWNGLSDISIYAYFEPLVYGDTGEGGGTIFYKKSTFSDGWQYLEAAPAGWNGTDGDPAVRWGGSNDQVLNVSNTALGAGSTNTGTIVDTLGDGADDPYAAWLCDSYESTRKGVTYDDWYLPSSDELYRLFNYSQAELLGDNIYNKYWSSTEANVYLGNCYVRLYTLSTQTGAPMQNYAVKSEQHYVRPIRKF
jgi:uncharacterized repeat protein (TIGR02543 family)